MKTFVFISAVFNDMIYCICLDDPNFNQILGEAGKKFFERNLKNYQEKFGGNLEISFKQECLDIITYVFHLPNGKLSDGIKAMSMLINIINSMQIIYDIPKDSLIRCNEIKKGSIVLCIKMCLLTFVEFIAEAEKAQEVHNYYCTIL